MTDLPNPIAFTREDWQADAACRGSNPDLFFNDKGHNAENAKAICAGCPVAQSCLEYALRLNITHGIFGGLSPRERRPLARPARVIVTPVEPRPVEAKGPIEHGTVAGWHRHARARRADPNHPEATACQPCRDAWNRYEWRRRIDVRKRVKLQAAARRSGAA